MTVTLLLRLTSMRPIVSYDDITLPYDDASASASVHAPPSQPPAKKRKNNNQSAQPVENEEEEEALTHEEIWDDSALIDAWNSAQEEYAVRVLFIFTDAANMVS